MWLMAQTVTPRGYYTVFPQLMAGIQLTTGSHTGRGRCLYKQMLAGLEYKNPLPGTSLSKFVDCL